MDTMDKTQRLNRTIPCSNCGEMYSISYKRCPFCGGTTRKRSEPAPPPQPRQTQPRQIQRVDDDEEMDWTPELEGMSAEPTSRGGKRLQKPTGGVAWGRALLVLLSLAIVAAAIYIVVTKVAPLIEARLGGQDSAQTSDGQTKPEDKPEASTTFRLLDTKATLTQAGETKLLSAVHDGEGKVGDIRWESSDPSIVSVSMDGKLTALKPGEAVISAVCEDGSKAECQVSCIWDTAALPSNLSLNSADFTLGAKDPSVTLKVIGTTDAVTWRVKNPAIATVSETGVVKYVATGKTEVTATVGGQTLICIVRCK